MIQAAILVLSGISIWLVGRKEKWSRWGYITGLCSQPFWIYTTFLSGQWGMFLLSIWYVYAWGQGLYNHWVINDLTGDIND